MFDSLVAAATHLWCWRVGRVARVENARAHAGWPRR